MFDAKRLIDQFLGAGGSANLQQTIGSVLGQLGQSGPQGSGGAGGLVGRGRDYVSGNAGALATGAVAGGLLSLVLGSKGGRKLGGSALKLGGLAAIGGLAYKAYQDYQAGRPPLGLDLGGRGGAAFAAPQAEEPALLPPPSTPAFTSEATAQLVLSAMISAAKADGHLDDKERARIQGELGALDSAAQAFIDAELATPIDIDALAARATSPEVATQVYAASLIAIDPDTDVERAYLAELAARLKLDPALKAHHRRSRRRSSRLIGPRLRCHPHLVLLPARGRRVYMRCARSTRSKWVKDVKVPPPPCGEEYEVGVRVGPPYPVTAAVASRGTMAPRWPMTTAASRCPRSAAAAASRPASRPAR